MATMVSKKGALAVIIAIFASACGPVNDPSQSVASQSNIGNVDGPAVRSSKNKQYLLYLSRAEDSGVQSAKGGAKVGKNHYRMRFVHSSDLHQPSAVATVSAKYFMPDMLSMGTFNGKVERQEDGSFDVMINYFHGGGTWQVEIHFSDGVTEDDFVFQVDL